MNELQPFNTLSYERLDAYRLALEFHQSLIPLARGRELYALRDQLLRAVESVVLNIAEGAGRTAPADKRRFYAIARGSAMEATACLDLLRNRHAIAEAVLLACRSRGVRLIRVLSALSGALQKNCQP